ncbi:hypothetical protein TIFTF001_026980, partial [Ficus carica]
MLMVYHIIIHLALHNPSHPKSSPSPVILPPPATDADDHLMRRPATCRARFSPSSLLLSPAVTTSGAPPPAGRGHPPSLFLFLSLLFSLSSPFSLFSSLLSPLSRR